MASFYEKAINIIYKNRLTIAAFVAIVLTACANEVAPTGGARDTEPPKLKRAEPGNKTTMFAGNKIKFYFDEHIGQGVFARTLLSPPLLAKPKFRVSGKSLTVVLPQTLAPATTYTINFADDLKDLNEGNAILNFSYVFSTGAVIDSQIVRGKVMDAATGEPADEAIVMLHPRDSVDGVLHNRPTYFAITAKDGSYQIGYIKAASYQLFVLKDQNINYLYDQQNEMIGFKPEKIELFDTLAAELDLVLFQEEKKKQKLIEKSFVQPGHLLLVYSAPIKTIEIKSNLDSAGTFAYLSEQKDSIHYWYANPFEKQADLLITANDTLKDSVRIKFSPPKLDTAYSKGIKPLLVDYQLVSNNRKGLNPKMVLPQELYGSFKIFFSRPCIGISDSAGAILVTNDSAKTAIAAKVTTDEKSKMFAEVDFPKEEETSYTIKVPAGYFTDIFGTKNDTATFHILTKKKEDYGILKLKVVSEDNENRIVELISSKSNSVVETIFVSGAGTRVYNFKNLAAENYFIKVIEDKNKNGKWNTGNFAEKIQPEKIVLYKNLPELKGGWEAEFELKLNQQQPSSGNKKTKF
jgi:hypothetical protein